MKYMLKMSKHLGAVKVKVKYEQDLPLCDIL